MSDLTASDLLKMFTGSDRLVRDLLGELQAILQEHACVYLTGTPEVGKSDLALELELTLGDAASYFNLSLGVHRQKLVSELPFLAGKSGQLVIIDEIQEFPDVLNIIRETLQAARLGPQQTGLFLLLGAASMPTIRLITSKLGTSVKVVHLTPFKALEVAVRSSPALIAAQIPPDISATDTAAMSPLRPAFDEDRLWLRGGYPLSYFAKDDNKSLAWRQAYIESICHRDYTFLGPTFSAAQAREHLQRLAATQGEPFVWNKGRVDEKAFLDTLEGLGMVRFLRPWFSNNLKRLEKNPKLFLRDSGLLNCLLGRRSIAEIERDAVICGHSWEGFCIENIVAAAPSAEAYYYRDQDQDEIDLVLEFPGQSRIAIEIKRSADNVDGGFTRAIAKIGAQEAFVVAPIETGYSRTGYRVVSLLEMISIVRSR